MIKGVQFGSGAAPCALEFRAQARNSTGETIYVGRVDYDARATDHWFAHFKIDKGLQASYTDPLNPLFNTTSKQPEYDGQLNESHVFSPALTNQFVFATMYYRATFANPQLASAIALFPYTLSFASRTFTTLGGQNFIYPDAISVH